ncbi:hypothetical protein [Rubricoccus marinus]|uniref:Peptidase M41 domain-containing protein n=1 Tax=Rubricoccus marinus TaxID=716817 RepID=A0A259TYU7_9BACT|nr:hypothetical protein [Rubricoccus marinus]OZC02922.1 hypothetical protein BSZ36_08015 [Rubricoccus marinus]
MIPDFESKIEALCYHEAGHFVLCLLFGFNVKRVVLSAEMTGVEHDYSLPNSDDSSVGDYITMSIGGGIAEEIFTGDESLAMDEDRRQVLYVARHLRPHLVATIEDWRASLLTWKDEARRELSKTQVWAAVEYVAQQLGEIEPPSEIVGSDLSGLVESTN